MMAYLVIREGTSWTDVFRLVAGRSVTIGRAATNQIVVKDERSSRNHAEIFLTQGRWTLRDLESRNGTLVDGERVRGDYQLTPGQIIRIANCQIAFVNDVSKAFADTPPISGAVSAEARDDDDTTIKRQVVELSDSDVLAVDEPSPTIMQRRGQTRFLANAIPDEAATPRVGRSATKLCRLAFDLARQTDVRAAANLTLDTLFESTDCEGGAVLLAEPQEDPSQPPTFSLIAARTKGPKSYQRVTEFLSQTVCREREAVLARNVRDDGQFGSHDSKGELVSTSVICAPVRQNDAVCGLVHLYSLSTEQMLDSDDLEFTLAAADNLALAFANAQRQQELTENLSAKQNEISQLRSRLGVESKIIGTSAAVAKVHQDIARAAPSRATVLIRGESGAGKELVAQAIHYSSPRKGGPFVCLNCAALSETLLESELFGHERGAFTGATERKIGKFEAAHQGTLMLDEIGEMSPAIQAKFLRVLEGHPFERVGGSKAIKVDVRTIAATNRDLEKAVGEGRFRRDLYFRLHVVEIYVPPLRKRIEDVVELANYFLERFSAETGRRLLGYSAAALECLKQYRWPGNIRELKNVVERAVVLARGNYIEAEDLILSNLAPSTDSGELPQTKEVFQPLSLEEVERRHIQATLDATGWNKSRTSAILGIERSTLDRKIRRYDLRPSEGAEAASGK